MRLAIVHWFTRAVGGIATRVNTYRRAAIKSGDTCDILLSKKNASGPKLFKERRWVHGGDTKIWIDGNAPHGERVDETIEFINSNYDAVMFSFICPHPCPTYPEPDFMPLYERITLPKVAFISDWYWKKYAKWAVHCLPYLKGVATLVPSYADEMREDVPDVRLIPVPFMPMPGTPADRYKSPLLIWPNQWRSFKGPKYLLPLIPKLKGVRVELYSSGIRYYQLRTSQAWIDAVGSDNFTAKYSGNGKALFYGNVSLEEMAKNYQRAWFSINFQGMGSSKEALQKGTHNNAEIEALYYGTCPILHRSTSNTGIPEDCYLPFDDCEEIPSLVKDAIKTGYAICPDRRRRAREFVMKNYWWKKKYADLKDMILS